MTNTEALPANRGPLIDVEPHRITFTPGHVAAAMEASHFRSFVNRLRGGGFAGGSTLSIYGSERGIFFDEGDQGDELTVPGELLVVEYQPFGRLLASEYVLNGMSTAAYGMMVNATSALIMPGALQLKPKEKEVIRRMFKDMPEPSSSDDYLEYAGDEVVEFLDEVRGVKGSTESNAFLRTYDHIEPLSSEQRNAINKLPPVKVNRQL